MLQFCKTSSWLTLILTFPLLWLLLPCFPCFLTGGERQEYQCTVFRDSPSQVPLEALPILCPEVEPQLVCHRCAVQKRYRCTTILIPVSPQGSWAGLWDSQLLSAVASSDYPSVVHKYHFLPFMMRNTLDIAALKKWMLSRRFLPLQELHVPCVVFLWSCSPSSVGAYPPSPTHS